MNRAHRRDDIGIERKGADGFEELFGFLVVDRRYTYGQTALSGRGWAVGVRGGAGDLRGSKRLDSVHAPILVMNVELNGIETDLDRLAGIVAEENFDGEDPSIERIGFTENMLGAGSVGKRRGGDGDAGMLVMWQ